MKASGAPPLRLFRGIKDACGADSLLVEVLVQVASWDGVCYWQRVVQAAVVAVLNKSGTLRAASKAASCNSEFELLRKLAYLTD